MYMTDLFRFMVLRTAEQVKPEDTIPIDDSDQSSLFGQLRQASGSSNPQAAMQQVARTFVTQNKDFVQGIDSLNFGDQLAKVVDEFQNPEGTKPASDALTIIAHHLFPKLAQVVTDPRFLNDKRRIHDSIVALQITPLPVNSPGELLVNLSRAVSVIERAAAADSTLKEPGALPKAAARVVVLPSSLFPLSSPISPTSPGSVPTDPTGGESGQNERLAALKDALLAVNEMIAVNTTSSAAIHPVAANPLQRSVQAGAPTLNLASRVSPTAQEPLANITDLASNTSGQLFSPSVQAVLADLHIDLSKTPLISAADKIHEVINSPILYAVPDPFHEVPPPLEASDNPPAVLIGPYWSHGSVQPAGIADLLVVREHVLRYEPSEIAFVENVAVGESFKRQTLRKNTTVNSTLTATFSGSETERDLQVSDRFNLQAQSQAAIQDDNSTGVSSSGSYGPLVDSGGSTKQAVPQASSYGQDVTRRALTKVISATQSQVFQQTTSEFDETVEHDFDNKASTTSEIVVYQWLDKIVQAKVFSYGKRLLYDFVIPEPAVFLAYARSKWQPELAALKKPTLFPLQSQDLSIDPKSDNYYQYWATGYGATGIQPPPEPNIKVVRAYGDKGSDPQGDDGKVLFTGISAKENIDIPAGYAASTAAVTVDLDGGAPNTRIHVVIGTQYFELNPSLVKINPVGLVHNEVGQIPITVMAWNAGEFILNVEINCTPTSQYLAQWQARTHDTILQASRDRLSEYEDQLHTLTADLQVKFAGKGSDQKQTLIRAELEKGCVTILTSQHFDGLNAVEYSPPGGNGFPQLFLPNVELLGRYIRFFEQAFEWDQMLYRYYPYFWGRKKYWNDRLQLDDQDAEFAAFLEAGAARVTVPVRKGYESAVATFMTNGTIPSSADILSVTTGLYVPFFVEMMGADGGPDGAVPYGDPPLEWEVRVPTTLVKIRTNNTLPRWEQTKDAQDRVTYTPVVPGDPVTP
jgi:hypothetical protein